MPDTPPPFPLSREGAEVRRRLTAAETERDRLRQGRRNYREVAVERGRLLEVAEARIARVEALCDEWQGTGNDASCLNLDKGRADFRDRVRATLEGPASGLTSSVVPGMVERIQWAAKQCDEALRDSRLNAAAAAWLRTIREGLTNASGDMPRDEPRKAVSDD